MQYVGNIIRPPSEANSIILQVTVGCSHNKCTFCGAYKDQPFSIKNKSVVQEDIVFAKKYCRNMNRVFLADGDVLSLPQKHLVELLTQIGEHLPWVKRVSLYATAKAIRHKSLDDLCTLKALGLDRVYLGLESGCPDILKSVIKRDTPEQMISSAQKINEAGLYLSTTVLLGLGGVNYSTRHIVKTAEVLNLMQPRQIAALTLMLLPNTELGKRAKTGDFVIPDAIGILREMRLLVSQLTCRTQFHANHASTFLPITGRLPKNRQDILNVIDSALDGSTPLVADNRRAL